MFNGAILAMHTLEREPDFLTFIDSHFSLAYPHGTRRTGIYGFPICFA
jgi:hypothetical protein